MLLRRLGVEGGGRDEQTWTPGEVVVMETEAEKHGNEDQPPEDDRESCLMCGACEVLGKGCVLHAS